MPFIRAVDIQVNLKDTSIAIKKEKAFSLRRYIQAINPVDTSEMNNAWRVSVSGDRVILRNDTEQLPFVRAYYIRRQDYDFIDDSIRDWEAGKPPRPRLRPIKVDYRVSIIVISTQGTVIRLTPQPGAGADKDKLESDAKQIIEYLESISPVAPTKFRNSGKMKRSWKYFIESGGTILLTNTAKSSRTNKFYLVFPRAYYISNQSTDLVKDAILDYQIRKPKTPTLKPFGF